ncbi:MAG: N-acetylglutaminylglutamine amidotransferase [Xanthobacteraceae bacterium]
MCGFCGVVNSSSTADASLVTAMLQPLAKRGPDATGIYLQDRVGFGHRRLSILDLAPTSQQPMVDPQLGLGIVFNGCIYNFKELRAELKEKGFTFFSDGDTEVILKAYAAWGRRCVERFFGMFAFGLWERDSGRVLLARDRLGIKPLYYADTDSGLRFASTLPALLAGGGIDTSIHPAALHHYMSWHSVVPPPLTILNGVKKLAPATLMVIEPDGRRVEEVYWRVEVGAPGADRGRSKAEWSEALLAALDTAVERRLVSDVPIGVLLSGGLDSSLLVGLLARKPGMNLKTFSIGFEAVGGIAGDEFKYSDLIAQRFATEHHRLRAGPQEALDALPGTIAAMSEPMMSHDAVGFYLLSREVSKHVKVVQTGQGADEILGGYHWYPRLLDSNDLTGDYARVYFDRDHAEMREALAPRFMNGDYSREFVDAFFQRAGGTRPVDKALQLDTDIMLVDDPVKRVDNMTMAFGLEARVPFLDHEVVELAARMPADLKVEHGGKYILKEAARSLIPREVIDRPKGYFPVPALKYLRGPFLDFVRDILNSCRARQRELFAPSYVHKLLADPEHALTPKGHSKLWQVALLESWLQTHGL